MKRSLIATLGIDSLEMSNHMDGPPWKMDFKKEIKLTKSYINATVLIQIMLPLTERLAT